MAQSNGLGNGVVTRQEHGQGAALDLPGAGPPDPPREPREDPTDIRDRISISPEGPRKLLQGSNP